MVNRYYSSTAVQTELSSAVSSTATTLPVLATSGFPTSYPYTLILDSSTTSEELVEVSAAVGLSLTVTRGIDGTSGVAHSAGTTVLHGVSGRDHREPQEHIAASTNVHGIGGSSSVVGTATTQTLTGKTLTSPTITTPAISTPTITSGGSWAGSPSLTSPTITTPTITGGTYSGGTFATATMTAPTIADFTNAAHDHSAANKGANIPQASVTGLSTRLTTIEGVNTTQDSTISSQGSTISSHTSTLSSHGTRLDTLEAQAIVLYTDSQTGTFVPNTGLSNFVNFTGQIALTVTVPSSGKVLVGWGFEGQNSHSATSTVRLGLGVSGANAISATTGLSTCCGGEALSMSSRWHLYTGLTAGSTTFTMKGYFSSGSSTDNSVDNQWLSIRTVP